MTTVLEKGNANEFTLRDQMSLSLINVKPIDPESKLSSIWGIFNEIDQLEIHFHSLRINNSHTFIKNV